MLDGDTVPHERGIKPSHERTKFANVIALIIGERKDFEVYSCDVSPDGFTVAAGTDLQGDDANIFFWYGIYTSRASSTSFHITGTPGNQLLRCVPMGRLIQTTSPSYNLPRIMYYSRLRLTGSCVYPMLPRMMKTKQYNR